jgi:hypothetical protein
MFVVSCEDSRQQPHVVIGLLYICVYIYRERENEKKKHQKKKNLVC